MTPPDLTKPPASLPALSGTTADAEISDPRPAPSAATLARAQDARGRNADRPRRLSAKIEEGASGRIVRARHTDDVAQTQISLDAFGTSSTDFVAAEMTRVLDALRPRDKPAPSETDFNAALAVIDGSQPDGEIAAMLASQMAATHALAMHFIGRTRRADTQDGLHSYGAMATRLLRTFAIQTEAAAKLKRGGAQTVRVEHVHVHGGGQAFVGIVGAGAGGRREFSPQPFGSPDAGALAAPDGAALFGQDAER